MKEVEENQQKRQDEEKASGTQKSQIMKMLDHARFQGEPVSEYPAYDHASALKPSVASAHSSTSEITGTSSTRQDQAPSQSSDDKAAPDGGRRSENAGGRASSLKRSASDMSHMTDSNKRQRLGVEEQDRASTAEPSAKQDTRAGPAQSSVLARLGIRPRKVAPPSSSQPPPSSQPDARPSRVIKSEALPFGVVKDPRSEATVLRLSQGSQETPSQKLRNVQTDRKSTRLNSSHWE